MVYMEAVRNLFSAPESRVHVNYVQKDKLTQTKLREREIKDILKQQREMKKKEKQEEEMGEKAAWRHVRSFYHSSKRFAKDEREATKRSEKKEAGSTCEHGIWKCRICNPVVKHK